MTMAVDWDAKPQLCYSNKRANQANVLIFFKFLSLYNQQSCVTVCYRYSGAKKYAEAIDLLYNGSQTLLQHKQVSAIPYVL